jgi:hypothetical protein
MRKQEKLLVTAPGMAMAVAKEEMVTAEDHAVGKILLILKPKRRCRETGSAFFVASADK